MIYLEIEEFEEILERNKDDDKAALAEIQKMFECERVIPYMEIEKWVTVKGSEICKDEELFAMKICQTVLGDLTADQLDRVVTYVVSRVRG